MPTSCDRKCVFRRTTRWPWGHGAVYTPYNRQDGDAGWAGWGLDLHSLNAL